MINKKYLEQAVRIKKDFLELSEEMEYLTKELEKNKEDIEGTLKGLISIKDKTSDYTSDEEYRNDIMEELKDFEFQAKKLEDIYKPVNEKVENLRDEENKLYKTLKEEYPNIKESKIIKEIKDYIKEKV